ncbi:MHS family MFS transporter [Micrococcales bacterium 31B]|nr:MHS family MFS transporter [Micrococcales bacterium 31B]
MSNLKSSPLPGGASSIAEHRRVAFATIVGTTVEWYDFFIYAFAAGLVFSHVFFEPAGAGIAQILSFLTVGLSFLFRPLGAFLAGHFGDKFGRRVVLMWTLIMMGVATALIGVLPTTAQIGLAAPAILIFLRIVQGISAGGEWGGAVLMAVEHAPNGKRGIMGAAPQLGVPLGMLLASGVLAVMNIIAPGDAFNQWGWRVPFLLSIVMIFIGIYIRSRVEESPVFAEIAARSEQTKMPIIQLLKKHPLLVLLAAGLFMGNNAVGYMTTGGFLQNYATNPEGALKMDRGPVLWAVAIGAIGWFVFTWLGGYLADKIGRRNTYLIGWVALLVGIFTMFPLVNQGTFASLTASFLITSVGLGLTYGPQAAFYTELFPASVRFSGVSISYAIGAIFGGAFAPTVAQLILKNTGGTSGISMYLAGVVLISIIATLILKDRSGIPLGPDHEAEQQVSPIRGIA